MEKIIIPFFKDLVQHSDIHMTNLQESFNLAVHHHQAGNLEQAEKILRELLKTHPEEYSLLGSLANVLQDIGHPYTESNTIDCDIL